MAVYFHTAVCNSFLISWRLMPPKCHTKMIHTQSNQTTNQPTIFNIISRICFTQYDSSIFNYCSGCTRKWIFFVVQHQHHERLTFTFARSVHLFKMFGFAYASGFCHVVWWFDTISSERNERTCRLSCVSTMVREIQRKLTFLTACIFHAMCSLFIIDEYELGANNKESLKYKSDKYS